eukprot:12900211-Prorocentrum_lima.AAC.1
MWLKRSHDSQESNPNTTSKRMQHISKQLKRQAELVPFEDAARKMAFLDVARVVEDNNQLARASDWVSALGGTKAGVYLLYVHPGCDWGHTLKNPLNAQRLKTDNPVHFRGKGIYPLNA